MYLKRIVLDKFKKHDHLEKEFVPGINVVKGRQNEAGKSTLIDGIVAALFSRPDSSSKELDKYTAWNSGNDRAYLTRIEFQQGDDVYCLEKNFREKNMVLTVNGSDVYKTYRKASEIMKNVFGVFPEKEPQEVFLSTACIKQNDVIAVNLGMKEMGSILEQVVMTGSSESSTASRLLMKLEKSIASVKKSLREEEAEIAQITQKLSEIVGIVEKTEALRLERVDLENQLSNVKKKYETLNTLLEKNKRRREISENITTLKTQYKSLDELIREIEDLQRKRDEAEENIASIQSLNDKSLVDEVARGLNELEIKRRDIADDLPKRRKEASEKETRLANARVSPRILILIAIVAVVASAVFAVIVHPLALLGLIIAIIAFTLNGSLVREKTRLGELKTRIKQMEDGLHDLDSKTVALLQKVDCPSVAEFNDRKQALDKFREKKIIWENQLQGKLGKKTLESFCNERSEVARKLAVEEAKLTDDLKNTEISAEQYILYESEVQELQDKETQLEKQISKDSGYIEEAHSDVEQRNSHEEQLANLQERSRSLQRQLKIYAMVRELVIQARNDVLRSPGGVVALEKETQNYLSVFTAGKYNRVHMPNNTEKQELKFEIYSEEKKDWVSPDKLSKGTIDEAYLACRLALVKLIYGDKRPPLILDDPFVNFDDTRLARTLNFFKELSREYQIIIFTLRDTYDAIADKIISLEE